MKGGEVDHHPACHGDVCACAWQTIDQLRAENSELANLKDSLCDEVRNLAAALAKCRKYIDAQARDAYGSSHELKLLATIDRALGQGGAK